MKVECKLKRHGGTKAHIAGKEFHFKPNAEGDHVCEIDDDHAVHRFVIQIPEAYRLYGDVSDAELQRIRSAKPSRVSIANSAAADSGKQPSAPIVISDGEREINLTEMDLPELVALARDTFDIKVHHKWNADTVRNKIVEATRKE